KAGTRRRRRHPLAGSGVRLSAKRGDGGRRHETETGRQGRNRVGASAASAGAAWPPVREGRGGGAHRQAWEGGGTAMPAGRAGTARSAGSARAPLPDREG